MVEKDSGNIPVPTVTLCHPGPIPMVPKARSPDQENQNESVPSGSAGDDHLGHFIGVRSSLKGNLGLQASISLGLL